MVRLFLVCASTAVFAQLLPGSAPRWFGTWKAPNGILTITREVKDPNFAIVQASIATADGCKAEAAGRVPVKELGRVTAAVKVGHPDDNRGLCTMSLTLVDEAAAINLKQEGACADLHGPTCDFKGRYVRQTRR